MLQYLYGLPNAYLKIVPLSGGTEPCSLSAEITDAAIFKICT